MERKGYKLIMDANPGQLDAAIDKFLETREKVEIRHYGDFKMIPQQSIPGMVMPKGMQPFDLQMMFFALVIYKLNEKELEDQKKINLHIES